MLRQLVGALLIAPLLLAGVTPSQNSAETIVVGWSDGASAETIAAALASDSDAGQVLEALAARERDGFDTAFPATEGLEGADAAEFIEAVVNIDEQSIGVAMLPRSDPDDVQLQGGAIRDGSAWSVALYQYQSTCTTLVCTITDRRMDRLTISPYVNATRVELSQRLCQVGDCAGMGYLAMDFWVWRSGATDGAHTLNGTLEWTFNLTNKRVAYVSHTNSHEGRRSTLVWDADWYNAAPGQIVGVPAGRTGWPRCLDSMCWYP